MKKNLFLIKIFITILFFIVLIHGNYKEKKLEQTIITQSSLIKDLQKENKSLKNENIVLEEKVNNLLKTMSIEDKFKFAANAYNIDWKLVYAIARLETGNFTSGLFIEGNNPGGMRTSNGWISYKTQSEGIIEMTRLIKYNYWDQGLQTPETIGPKYCPEETDNWIQKVKSIMGELE